MREVFRHEMQSAGLRPRDIVADGKVRRCPTEDKPYRRNGWYVLHPDGRGVYGNWAMASGPLGHWRDEGLQSDPTAVERARMQLHDQRLRDRNLRINAIRAARTHWNSSQPLRHLHPYLRRKGLSALGCTGLREHGSALVVPVVSGEWIVSTQSIYEDGSKRFWPGAPVKGGAFVIERKCAAVTVFVEGLATGLAIFQSVRHSRVIVAFDAGNLAAVVQRMKPVGQVVIAADNDIHTEQRIGINPGLEAAHRAAALIGCGVAWPQGIEGTDWCDALTAWGGPVASRKIERLILAQARYVTREST